MIEEQIEKMFWKGYCDDQSCCVHQYDGSSERLVKVYPEIMEKLKALLTKSNEEAVRGFAKHIEGLVEEGRVLALVGEMPTSIAEAYLQSLDKGDGE